MKQHHIVFSLHLLCVIFAFTCCNEPANSPVNQDEYIAIDSLIHNIPFVKVEKGPFTHGMYDESRSIDYNYWIMKYEATNQLYFNFLKSALNDGLLFLHGDSVVWNYDAELQGDNVRPSGKYNVKILDDRIYIENGELKLNAAYKDHPVTEVSWFGGKAFCQSYGFDLPDKYEWEKAARGNTGWNYPWGDTLQSNRANYHNSGDPFDNGTSPVGFYDGRNYNGYQTQNSPSPFGCYDMAGNAWEYTNSFLGPDIPFVEGGGGGYLYHTGAMTQSWYFSKFGFPYPIRLDRPFKTDGCRCISK